MKIRQFFPGLAAGIVSLFPVKGGSAARPVPPVSARLLEVALLTPDAALVKLDSSSEGLLDREAEERL